VIEWQDAEGKADRLPGLAAELARLKVDLIVTEGPTGPVLPKKQLLRVPLSWGLIVTLLAPERVASLARPGGNITGLSTLAPEISGKQLELLKGSVDFKGRLLRNDARTPTSNCRFHLWYIEDWIECLTSPSLIVLQRSISFKI
jgi:hypothetical protein